MVKSRLSNQR